MFFVCHDYDDFGLCVDVHIFVVTSPDFAHPKIYGITLV